uniref:Uncharacterized protein n=1 Tax=Psilocybe cubensis TaxID=181762 RepID=A0A8H7Y1U1_PSICU
MSPCGIQPSRLARFALFFSLFWVPRVDADGVNRTIDDTFGDSVTKQRVTYTPASGVWHDATCLTSSGCAIVGDPTQCFSSTYTAATYRDPWSETSIAMQFNGTAIYVFFILANNMGTGIITQTVANFTLDGGQPQLFTHQPDPNTKDLNYGQLVFSLTNLTNSEHTLVISASEVHINSYINFDYAVYTCESTVSMTFEV